jgi:hypothetical protein
MSREELLARLIMQAEDQGGDVITLRAVVEEASELGASRVLARMGLEDETAHDDLAELRQLLGAWRDAKHSAWRALLDWAVRALLALLLCGIAFRLGLGDLMK